MKWAGYVEVSVSKIALPGDIAARMKEPRVVALAASTDELGGQPMHAPSVNADVTPWVLVAGRDRMAATLLRKRKKVWVHVGKGWTDLELLKAEIYENLHRRHDDKAALTRALVDKAEVVVGHASENCAPQQAVGRPKSARTQAQEIVAEVSGETLGAVRKRDARAQARDEEAAGSRAGVPVPEPLPPLVETFGHELPEHVAAGLASVLATFDKADRKLREAQTAIGDLGLTDYTPGVVQKLKAAIHEAAAMVRYERPTHLCPKCFGKSGKDGPRCGLCMERGVVTTGQYEAAPKRGLPTATPEQGVLIEQMVALEPDSPERKRKEAEIHALTTSGGPCGCRSCNFVRDEKTKAAPPRVRHIPPIKAGVTYTMNDAGDVVEQAKAPPKKRGLTIEVNGKKMSADEATAWAAAQEAATPEDDTAGGVF